MKHESVIPFPFLPSYNSPLLFLNVVFHYFHYLKFCCVYFKLAICKRKFNWNFYPVIDIHCHLLICLCYFFAEDSRRKQTTMTPLIFVPFITQRSESFHFPVDEQVLSEPPSCSLILQLQYRLRPQLVAAWWQLEQLWQLLWYLCDTTRHSWGHSPRRQCPHDKPDVSTLNHFLSDQEEVMTVFKYAERR